jgi:transcription initiation factor TFIID subunit TAF12
VYRGVTGAGLLVPLSTAHDCPDAGPFIDTDRSPVCASLDQNRLDAMKKLAELKKSAITSQEVAEASADETVLEVPQ